MESIKEIKAEAANSRQRARSLLVFTLMTVIATGMAAGAQAQTFAEWFAQKKTQKKYLLQQIAALKVYSTYLKQGYGVASQGLGSISGYLKSENTLHHTYYTRLKTADVVVKNNTMVTDIMNWQQDILKRTREIRQVSALTAGEKTYLASVCAAVLKDCDQQLVTLQTVTSDNQMEMSDAERLALITKVHTDMLANYQFTSSFATQVKILVFKRQQEQQEVSATKRIYGIN